MTNQDLINTLNETLKQIDEVKDFLSDVQMNKSYSNPEIGQSIQQLKCAFDEVLEFKVVDVSAEKNEDLLRSMISMDEGAAYLGECALVPYDSPIRNSGITFYNTLFDENACCHLALGRGFNECLEGYANLSFDECKEKGINDSLIHVDFMIGSEDLEIEAVTRDGKTVKIFEKGNWAF